MPDEELIEQAPEIEPGETPLQPVAHQPPAPEYTIPRNTKALMRAYWGVDIQTKFRENSFATLIGSTLVLKADTTRLAFIISPAAGVTVANVTQWGWSRTLQPFNGFSTGPGMAVPLVIDWRVCGSLITEPLFATQAGTTSDTYSVLEILLDVPR